MNNEQTNGRTGDWKDARPRGRTDARAKKKTRGRTDERTDVGGGGEQTGAQDRGSRRCEHQNSMGWPNVVKPTAGDLRRSINKNFGF